MTLITALFHAWAAMTHFWLGRIDQGIADLASTLGHTPPMGRAILESQLFVANVIAGRVPEANQIMAKVTPSLPIAGRRNHVSAWNTLETIIGLALLGETDRCGALYPAAKGWVETGTVLWSGLALSGPQLLAGVAAHAAALPEQAREHFETAMRHAREVPLRLLQPSAQFWYGRMLLDDPESSERLRGRAMLEAATTDFRSLEMVTYANLAETLLREAS